MNTYLTISLLFLVSSSFAQQQDSLPALLPPVTIEGENADTCPSADVLNQRRNDTKEAINSILRNTVTPTLNSRCQCGGPGWQKLAHLDMSDPNQQCPDNWRLQTSPVRACGRSTNACDSAIFPSNERSFSRVCGRVIALQTSTTDGLKASLAQGVDLESYYVDGVSLTHGPAGLRQHIWTFVSAIYETSPNPILVEVCPCMLNTDFDWPYQIPSFIGTNYFCDSGNPGPGVNSKVYSDNPLWDGEGCGPTSTCCQLNNAPWFCTTLPEPVSDDLELRICSDQHLGDENILVTLVDIYVQ